jgi:hypothetical protein
MPGVALRADFVLNEEDVGEAYQEDTTTAVRRRAVRNMLATLWAVRS